MKGTKVYLTGFKSIQPYFTLSQEESLAWMTEAHSRSHFNSHFKSGEESSPSLAKRIRRVACPPDKIHSRGSFLPDFTSSNWDEMRIFQVKPGVPGLGMSERMRFYSECTRQLFQTSYEGVNPPPDDLLHVTCTGYVAPSPAQRLVSEKGWGTRTTVTHLYHMGCYASLPAIRTGIGLLSLKSQVTQKKRVDIVHSELCSLHFNSCDHSLENIVVESLFADGFIRYSLEKERSSDGADLEVLGVLEEILPDTQDAMSWVCNDWGMRMTLSKDVPQLIGAHLKPFLTRLFGCAGFELLSELPTLIAAIHPGGPKILDQVKEILELREDQLQTSREILRERGNLSSATLPHIWQRILEEPGTSSALAHSSMNAEKKGEKKGETYRAGTLVLSLAFGPGLTISGGLFRMLP